MPYFVGIIKKKNELVNRSLYFFQNIFYLFFRCFLFIIWLNVKLFKIY